MTYRGVVIYAHSYLHSQIISSLNRFFVFLFFWLLLSGIAVPPFSGREEETKFYNTRNRIRCAYLIHRHIFASHTRSLQLTQIGRTISTRHCETLHLRHKETSSRNRKSR